MLLLLIMEALTLLENMVVLITHQHTMMLDIELLCKWTIIPLSM